MDVIDDVRLLRGDRRKPLEALRWRAVVGWRDGEVTDDLNGCLAAKVPSLYKGWVPSSLCRTERSWRAVESR